MQIPEILDSAMAIMLERAVINTSHFVHHARLYDIVEQLCSKSLRVFRHIARSH